MFIADKYVKVTHLDSGKSYKEINAQKIIFL